MDVGIGLEEMENELSINAQRVQTALSAFGLQLNVVELPASTRTAPEAAAAIGCTVEQIVKSLIFECQPSGKPVLIAASGSNRVSEARIFELIGEKITKANADFVRQVSGFPIGGVPPLAHNQKLDIIIDQDLLSFDEIWAAAGTPHAVFRLTPAQLVFITQGQVAKIT